MLEKIGQDFISIILFLQQCSFKTFTFKPFARLMARSGRKTLRIRNTLSTDNIWALLAFSPDVVNNGLKKLCF